MDKVIALIECLGDKVVDARDAYEAFAEVDDTTQLQRMSLLGLTKALAQLWYGPFNCSCVTTGIGVDRH